MKMKVWLWFLLQIISNYCSCWRFSSVKAKQNLGIVTVKLGSTLFIKYSSFGKSNYAPCKTNSTFGITNSPILQAKLTILQKKFTFLHFRFIFCFNQIDLKTIQIHYSVFCRFLFVLYWFTVICFSFILDMLNFEFEL